MRVVRSPARPWRSIERCQARNSSAVSTGLFKRQQSTPNGGDDFGFATNYPACGPRCWEISKCQRATIRADDILHFRALDSIIVHARLNGRIVSSQALILRLLPMKQSTERRSAVNHGHLPVPTPQHGLPRARLGRGRRLRGHGRDLCTVSCHACRQVHLVNPSTGKVVDDE